MARNNGRNSSPNDSFHDERYLHDRPLFEKIDFDEYQELKQIRQLNEALQYRVKELERINTDLEYRLEDQAKQNMSLEKECIANEREWKIKSENLEKEISYWKIEFETQKVKGDRLREHLSRTEREMYGLLQRKYEFMRGPAGTNKGGLNTKLSSGELEKIESISGKNKINDNDDINNNNNNNTNNYYDILNNFLVTPTVPNTNPAVRQKKMISMLESFLGI